MAKATFEQLLGLDQLNNYWGALQPQIRRRLLAVVKDPSERNWNNAYSVILRYGPGFGVGLTLWQAWIAIDPKALRVGPRKWQKRMGGKWYRDEWVRWPDAETIFDAIRHAATASVRSR